MIIILAAIIGVFSHILNGEAEIAQSDYYLLNSLVVRILMWTDIILFITLIGMLSVFLIKRAVTKKE